MKSTFHYYCLLFACYLAPPIVDCSCGAIAMDNNVFDRQTRAPNVSEHSLFASGIFKQEATINELEIIYAFPPILHLRAGTQQVHTTKHCKSKLTNLASIVNRHWNGQCAIKITRAFMEKKLTLLAKHSLHYEGRAIDLVLVNSECTESKVLDCTTKLKELAWLAFKYASFDFVSVKDHHLHISCKRSTSNR